MTTKSKKWRLNKHDLVKGLWMAVFTGVLTSVQQLYTVAGNFDQVNYKFVGGVAIASAISYLLKNFSTNSDDKVLKKESNKPTYGNFDPTKASVN